MAQTAAPAPGGQVFVDSLVAGGVEFFSCVPGESFLPVLDALYGLTTTVAGASVRLVTARHESAAGFMAEAAGKLTGRPAVCLVTRGPGAMHAAIAVHTAYQDGTPLVLAVGQIARAHRGREAFQEMDYRSVFSSTAKLVVEIDDVDRIPEIVARALHVATSGRPGPVVIALPEDVLYASTSVTPVPMARTLPVSPSQASVREIVEITTSAQRPLIIVGGSTWTEQAGHDIRRFAETHAIPIAAAFRSQDVIDNRSESYVGYLGLGGSEQLRRHAAEADTWIVLGARLDDPTTDGYALIDEGRAGRTIVLTGDDAAQASQTFMPDVSVSCSIESLARELATVPAAPSDERARRVAELRREHLDFVAADETGGLPQIVRHLRDVLPDDAVITNGAGNYTGWVQRYFEFRRARTQLAPHNGAMAYGLPAAIAAAAIRPGVPVVAFAGDGCFMMSGNELATAVQHDLDLTVVVVNNAMYGTIRMHQERQFPGRTIATELRNPDFVAYARAFGAGGWSVDSAAGFIDAFAEARRRGGVNLIEVLTDPDQITTGARLPITASRKGWA
jgi:acetolactate synthase-1/2/3 large subunit